MPGGTQIWFGRGCCSSLETPTHFKGQFGRKRYQFLGIFLKYMLIFHRDNFSGVHGKDPKIFEIQTHV